MEGGVNDYYMHVGSERFLRHNDIRGDHAAADKMDLDYQADQEDSDLHHNARRRWTFHRSAPGAGL